MARPSVSSQSIVDLASSKIQSNKANRSSNEHNPSSASPSDDEITQEHTNNKVLKSKKEQLKTIELIRKKYTLQNKSLAKNNSLMMLKISEMEAKVSDLINENMLLRKRRTFKDAELKRQLEGKLEVVETGLIHKFGEMFETLKSVRMREGIQENPKLDVFKDLLNETPPATSTPIEEEPEKGSNIFTFISRPPTQSSLRDDSFILPKSHLFLQTMDKKTKPSTGKETIEKIKSNSVEQKEDRIDFLGSSNINKSPLPRLENPKEKQKLQKQKLNENYKFVENRKKEVGLEEYVQEPLVPDNKAKSNSSHGFDVYEDNDEKNNGTDDVNNEPKQSDMSEKVKSHQLSIIEDADHSVGDNELEGNRRPSRSRKPVSYKWPSLSKKMRRQSEKLVDAVIVPDDEIMTPEPNIKQEFDSQSALKRSICSDGMGNISPKRTKRQPLGNVTHDNNNKTNRRKSVREDSKSKGTTKSLQGIHEDIETEVLSDAPGNRDDGNEDTSIFDFDNENKPPKTYKKRRQSAHKEAKSTYEKRRHSMLI